MNFYYGGLVDGEDDLEVIVGNIEAAIMRGDVPLLLYNDLEGREDA